MMFSCFVDKPYYIIGGAINDSTQLFEGDQRDVLILLERVQSFVVDTVFEECILRDTLFLHGLP